MKIIRKLVWLLPALAWLGVLFFFSGQTAAESSELSGWAAELLLRIMPFFRDNAAMFELVLRKIAHFTIFAIEGVLLMWGLIHIFPRIWLNIILATAFSGAVAVLNELHQLTSEGRACLTTDMLIDTAGAACGAIAAAVIYMLWKRLKR